MRVVKKTDHLVGAADEDGHGSRVGAFFDDEHSVASRAERQFANGACLAQLFGRQVFEPRYDSAVRRNRNELE